MTKQNHLQTRHHRRRAKGRDAASVGGNRGRPLHVERLEDRSMLSGVAAVDVADGGFVQLDTGDLVNYFLLSVTDDLVGSTGDATVSVRVDSIFGAAVAGSVARIVASGTNSDYEVIEASEGTFVMRIVSGDLPNKGTDADLVDVAPSTDHGNPVTEGGLVDLTPTPGDADPQPDPFPNKARQLASGLAPRPRNTTTDSAAGSVAVEGAVGRSQAFELAMLSDARMDGEDALPHADPSGPYDNRSAAPVRPATRGVPGVQGSPSAADAAPATNQRHEAVSRHTPFDRAGKAGLVSAINPNMGRERSNGGASDPGQSNTTPAGVTLANCSPGGLATHVVQMPDFVFDSQQIVFAEEENWRQGDLHWLTSNVHKGRQTHAIALVAAALVSLRSLGLYFPSRDENQVLWTPPRERRGARAV